MNYNKYNSELRKIMKFYGYTVLRKKNHIIWINPTTGERYVTPASSSDGNVLKRIKQKLNRQQVLIRS